MNKKNIWDYKNIPLLKSYVDDLGSIKSRRLPHRTRKIVTQAIKRARIMALLMFCDRH